MQVNQTISFHDFSIIPKASFMVCSVWVKGGENLIIFEWVGFAISPFSRSFDEREFAN